MKIQKIKAYHGERGWEMAKIRKIKPYHCPNCKANLRGGKIPKKQQHLFGADHFGREIGIYDRDKDRTVAFMCPDCNHHWAR